MGDREGLAGGSALRQPNPIRPSFLDAYGLPTSGRPRQRRIAQVRFGQSSDRAILPWEQVPDAAGEIIRVGLAGHAAEYFEQAAVLKGLANLLGHLAAVVILLEG